MKNYSNLLISFIYQGGKGENYTFVRVAIPLILCIKFSATLSATTMLCARPAHKLVRIISFFFPFSFSFFSGISKVLIIPFLLAFLAYRKLFQTAVLYERNLHRFETTPPEIKMYI